MSEKYHLSRKMNKIIERSTYFTERDPDHLTAEVIDTYNKKGLPKSHFTRRILYPAVRNITCTTYIIPVNEGAVTGYFYSSSDTLAITSVKPMLLFFHGGGWTFGNMELYGRYCSHLAHITGASVLMVDYRLAPQYRFPTAVEDCYDAYLWALQGIRYWKTDPDRIFLAGDSVGGTIAAGVSLLIRERKKHQPYGQILIYPMTDGRLRTESFELYGDSPTLNSKQMQFYIKTYQREPKDILSPLFSPLLAEDLSHLPETLIITGEYDPLKDDGRLFADALNKAGTKVACLEIKGALHGCINYRHAVGAEESNCIIRQFTSGRPVDKIQIMTEAELRRDSKLRMQQAQQRVHEEQSSGKEKDDD